MEAPNFFLADLPADVLTPAMVAEACIAIKRNRAQFLVKRNTSNVIRTIANLAESWQDNSFPFRQQALREGPGVTGFSEAVLAAGLDAFFAQITKRNLEQLVLQDLGSAQRLDEMASADGEQGGERAARAHGPELLVHIAGGVLPNPTLLGMMLGLLVRSAQFVKCPAGASFLPRLFAHSLYVVEPKLGACLELAAWPGGAKGLEEALFAHASCVTATGSDETLASIRGRLPVGARFIGHGHRLSLGYVTAEMLSSFALPRIVAQAADDITAWDQLGCLSPHAVYVETGGAASPEQFAELLAAELAKREGTHPRGVLPVEMAAAVAARRNFYEVRAAASPQVRCWFSPESTAWSVVFDAEPDFHPSCLHRFVFVKAVVGLPQFLLGIDTLHGKVSTVGLAATGGRAQRIANELSEWGVTRVCPLGRMQKPSLHWRHDGRPSLGELVHWTDWEMGY